MTKNKNKIEKFVASNKVVRTVDGRTNFARASVEFLVHAELINKGTGELSDIKAKISDDLASAENALALYQRSAVVESEKLQELIQKVDSLKESKRQANKAVREYMPKMTDADKRLYQAYFWYQTQPEPETHAGEFCQLYERAFVEWFDSWGMTMGKKDFKFFSTKLGVKKASNKKYRESGASVFTAVYTEKQFVELLYLIIIELMVKKGIIRNYEFTYVPKKDEKVETPETKKEESTKQVDSNIVYLSTHELRFVGSHGYTIALLP